MKPFFIFYIYCFYSYSSVSKYLCYGLMLGLDVFAAVGNVSVSPLSCAAESQDALLESPRPAALCTGPVTGSGEDPRVDLQGSDLWKRFHEIGTEMIITKAGRYEPGKQITSSQIGEVRNDMKTMCLVHLHTCE